MNFVIFSTLNGSFSILHSIYILQRYQKEVQAFKNQMNRSPKGKQRSDGSEFELTREKVRSTNERYSNLKSACDSLMNRYSPMAQYAIIIVY